ncbi:helix-turn-helix transcriptional regulator [Actinophytocola oryzae]|uniref:Putative DNA-binding transcriptional regulator YafY n=1 Tax=Actinophytocola oryzae TaxID=502181 RepID=A0A4V3FV02_9PSEU|nr:YafY family protein [Actinophytocola oryzae]TDV57131.1 putative DNA-binding transcriptional regulator YafY [Actinophytocola oryzae]
MSAGRLLALLSLLQTPREWPGSVLARRLEVSPRTIRRDVERLRELGYPVEAAMGAEGGYRLVAGAAMPPLLLDDEEAVAIAVGLRAAAGQAVEGIEEAAVRALTKIERVLPSRLRYRVGALGNATVSLVQGPQATVDPGQLTGIAAAVTNREGLRFAYRDADGGASRRHVEPYRLVSAGRRWYLVAFDLERDDWRVFRVDRIANGQPTGARQRPRELPGGDPVAFVTSRLYSLAPTYEAVVVVALPAAEVPAHLGTVEPVDERRSRVRAAADTLEWLAFRFVTAGCEFTVEQPPELVDYLRELGGRADRATRV